MLLPVFLVLAFRPLCVLRLRCIVPHALAADRALYVELRRYGEGVFAKLATFVTHYFGRSVGYRLRLAWLCRLRRSLSPRLFKLPVVFRPGEILHAVSVRLAQNSGFARTDFVVQDRVRAEHHPVAADNSPAGREDATDFDCR